MFVSNFLLKLGKWIFKVILALYKVVTTVYECVWANFSTIITIQHNTSSYIVIDIFFVCNAYIWFPLNVSSDSCPHQNRKQENLEKLACAWTSICIERMYVILVFRNLCQLIFIISLTIDFILTYMSDIHAWTSALYVHA